jgi:hypothetical protein
MILDGSAVELTLENQITLAAWTFKAAIISEDTHERQSKFFTARTRRKFHDSTEPQGHVWVWLAEYRGPHTGSEQIASTTPDTFAFTATIGRFALQVFASKHAKSLMIPDRWADSTVQIWPNIADQASWPPRQYLDLDSLKPFADRWAPRIWTPPPPIVRNRS